MAANDDMTESDPDCSIFERALDALPDGVLLVNSDRKVAYTNSAFKRLWQISSEVLASKDEEQALQYVMDQLVDPEGFRQEVERLHPVAETTEDEIEFKDGRIIARRSLPFQQNGSFSARIWIFTDITEAKNAAIDQLTGLPNRLAFSREFPPFVTAPSDGLERSVAIIDVDNFKRYNDLYGHALGDDMLSQIGAILASHVRLAGDLVFRIGGEEFLMAARTRSSDEARMLFEAVRTSILGMGVPHRGNEPHDVVTVSIGYGTFRDACEPVEVFKRVDEVLYRAKAQGRNRVSGIEI